MSWIRTPFVAALFPATLALALRLYGLSDKPLWLDEITTHVRARLPVADLLANSFHNKHFPTYFLLARAFDPPVIDEWMLRLPSAVFGAVSILLVAMIATEIKSARAGLIAGSLMALSPLDVQFGQEARPYALVSFLIMLALWGLVRIVRQHEDAYPPSRRRCDERMCWVAYVAGTIGVLNVLLVSVFWLIASNLAFAVVMRGARAERPQLLKRWAIAQTIILLTWLPALTAIFLSSHRDPLHGYRWIPPSTLEHVWSVIAAAYLYRASDVTTFMLLPGSIAWLGAVLVALAIVGAWQLKADTKLLSVIGFAALTMPIALSVMSIVQPFWLPRYLLWGTGPYFVLAGIGAAMLPRPIFPVVAASLLVAGLTNLAPYYRSETKPRWDLAAAYLAENIRPGDAIVTNDEAARYVLGAYGARYNLSQDSIVSVHTAPAARAPLASRRRLWVVYGRTGQGVMSGEQEYMRKWSILGAPASEARFAGDIVITGFDPEIFRSASGNNADK
jgi:mannosyltransferase